ncbi:MAG: TraR/DksA family transcriptional regulator [Rubrivivax sp.]|nr:TraR/DksA family transcriptional regulator [Rubrivivax sp.]MDP3224096.1 TraR/DksA family transcriptional regulator [Rubrivivax sp.]MDP3613555.1 TraR/DksA family transcriptional regulator [Rubrivivax sp.]
MKQPKKVLTSGQHALLEASLQQRQLQLQRRLSEHHGGLSRAEHAHEVLQQDGDDAPQREGERELDMALSDLETQDLGAVSAALLRMTTDSYGLCSDCGAEIPFDRLKVEPAAMRCVPCETTHENRHAAG